MPKRCYAKEDMRTIRDVVSGDLPITGRDKRTYNRFRLQSCSE